MRNIIIIFIIPAIVIISTGITRKERNELQVSFTLRGLAFSKYDQKHTRG